MAWQEPKTNWNDKDAVRPSDMNRIEGNILELKKAATIDIVDAEGNFTATNVEGALQELAGNVKNGKTNIANAIVAMGQSASGNDTFDTLAAKIRDISKDATAGTGDVLSGKTFYQGGAKKTGTMPNHGAQVITPGAVNKVIPAGYHNGDGYVVGDADLVAANIVKGKHIFGVVGNYYVPWIHDWGAYDIECNWSGLHKRILPESWDTMFETTGEGVLTYFRCYSVSRVRADVPDLRVTVDGQVHAFNGPSVEPQSGGVGNLIIHPIYFQQSIKIEVYNRDYQSGDQPDRPFTAYWVCMKRASEPIVGKNTLMEGSRVVGAARWGSRLYGTILDVSGSGYLTSVLAHPYQTNTNDAYVRTCDLEVTIDGTVVRSGSFTTAEPLMISSSEGPVHDPFMGWLPGPLRFETSALVRIAGSVDTGVVGFARAVLD